MKELASISARIQKITKEKSGDKSTFECPVCGKMVDEGESVTDISSGRKMCQDCYDKL